MDAKNIIWTTNPTTLSFKMGSGVEMGQYSQKRTLTSTAGGVKSVSILKDKGRGGEPQREGERLRENKKRERHTQLF